MLDVSENRLESLPESIALLRQLRELLAASNELRRRDAPLPPCNPATLQPCNPTRPRPPACNPAQLPNLQPLKPATRRACACAV